MLQTFVWHVGLCTKRYSLHSLCGHGLHFHKTHHSDTLRSNMTQRTEQTPQMSPTAFIWAIYSHPSLSVWSVGKWGDWLIHQSSLPPQWVREHERKPSVQQRFNTGTVNNETPFDMRESDSAAWHTAGSYRWKWRNPKGIPWWQIIFFQYEVLLYFSVVIGIWKKLCYLVVVKWTFNLHYFHQRLITIHNSSIVAIAFQSF